jgi:hypothetical protein
MQCLLTWNTRNRFSSEEFNVNIVVSAQFIQNRFDLSLKATAGQGENLIAMASQGVNKTHPMSRMGPIFCSVLATLNLTLATLSDAIVRTVGSMCFAVMSGPQASARTCKFT